MNIKKINEKPHRLSINYFARIQTIFNEKGWPIEDVFDDDVFENFCNMLASLNQEQCELILSLTKKFLWIRENEYIRLFSQSLDSFIAEYDFHRGKKIYICPLLPESDFGKSKSSVMLFYFVKVRMAAIQKKYSDFSITYIDSPNLVNIDLVKSGFTLCLIDDFIGTGETVENAMEYFTRQGVTLDMTSIISLASMDSGIEQLLQKGYKVYSAIKCPKGISDSDDSNDIAIKKTIMESIEEKINVADDFKFGYGASEALVKMMRTPNNTFPIYWLRKNNKFAPFPR